MAHLIVPSVSEIFWSGKSEHPSFPCVPFSAGMIFKGSGLFLDLCFVLVFCGVHLYSVVALSFKSCQ